MRKVTFPHMGVSVHPLTVLLQELGNEVIVPAEPTAGTLNLGTKYAPEFACLPLKITLGTYLEGLKRGADTIVTSGGVGPCRAGYYSSLQKRILESLGYSFDMIVFEPPRSHFRQTVTNIKQLNAARLSIASLGYLVYRVWLELLALDRLEAKLHQVRAREIETGEAEKRYREGVAAIQSATSPRAIKEAGKEALRFLEATPQMDRPEIVKVGIVGEIYVLLEPAANLYIERILGELHAEVRRSMSVTGWTMDNAVVEGGGFDVKKAAALYLPEMVGGHGQDSVGHTILYAKEGVDGVIQLAPFTCIPEIVAKGILPKVSEDYGIPVLSIFLDEQTGQAGLRTRLEAFVDMLRTKKLRKRAVA
ncbi:MAG TPA: CoA protein activase [Firmicutes bacterium]|nr:CoA protein activase [Bacillota bacterium]